jgi:hypothetical protein
MLARRAPLRALNRSTTVERYFRHRPFLVAKGTDIGSGLRTSLLGPLFPLISVVGPNGRVLEGEGVQKAREAKALDMWGKQHSESNKQRQCEHVSLRGHVPRV